MAKIRTAVPDRVSFHCPGCGENHTVPVNKPGAWQWNQSVDAPTITPSLDVKSGHYASHWKPGDECWCGKDYGFTCYRCHSIITNGRIFFCTDSTHKLAGQTVDMPEIAR
jgi:hypothetical protein